MEWAAISELVMKNLLLRRPPLGLHYQPTRPADAIGFKSSGRGCLVALLKAVERGKVLALSAEQPGCLGGRFYCGFEAEPREGQAEYVSTGVPGGIEGEHYVKSPDLCRRIWRDCPPPAAGDDWLVFQRLDAYDGATDPEVIVCFAPPDSIAGLHFLACYDRGVEGVIAPFASGCGSIIAFPRREAGAGTHRAVLGLFDPSARRVEEPEVLSFAADTQRFREMAANIGESFLQYDAWSWIRKRAARS